jgi:hypothetical protein
MLRAYGGRGRPYAPRTVSSRRAVWPWVLWSLFGIGGWIGATVRAAASVDEPSEAAGRVLATFAIGGAVFFGVTFAGAAVGIRRQRGAVDEDVYRRLLLVETSDRTVRAVTGGHRRLGYTYVVFGVITTALALVAFGLGSDRWSPPLLYGALAIVLAWCVVALRSMSSVPTVGDALLSPLGLRVTSVPAFAALPSGRGRLVGPMTFAGERHGRSVVVEQRPSSSTTRISGSRPRQVVSGPTELAARTGIDATRWRGVRVESGPDGVVVRRRGNGAGRWMLEDLLLAETLATD